MKHQKTFLYLVIVAALLIGAGQDLIGQAKRPADPPKPIVTFIELGSVRCIPCRMMQPVMKSIEAKYGGQVKIVFYDVWTEQGQPYAVQYGIRLIPTQVFLNQNGKEFFRHEGFFPEAEIDKLLQNRGLKIRKSR